jgi:ketosteroid isomerase-like protein
VKPEEKVLAANRRFYTALQEMSLEAMKQVWLHEEWVTCVHPGWELLQGWEEVQAAWQRIFRNTERMKVEISEISVHVEGGVAVVSCVEQVTSTYATGFSTAWVQATNLYVRREPEWLLVLHHASPIPREEQETVQ